MKKKKTNLAFHDYVYILPSPICKEKPMVRIQPWTEKQTQQKHKEKN